MSEPSDYSSSSSTGSPPRPSPQAETAPVFVPVSWPEMSPPPPLHRPPTSQSILLMPVPQAQQVPLLTPPYKFQTPSKKIQTQADALRFVDSPSGSNFLGFIVSLSESIRGRKISDPVTVNPTVSSLLSVLDSLIESVDRHPPVPQSSRYGNLAFRSWHQHLTSHSTQSLLVDRLLLLHNLPDASVELFPYFADSFGNASRIDYGTGHETNFAAFLYCLARLGVFLPDDYPALVSSVFVKYLHLMRTLQTVYCLEPAGSHGVWGLDDYHFLPFIFGSSQLVDHKYMKPKSIHNDDILDNFSDEYMYLSCVKFVKKVKKGVFAEHSPLLDDISAVPTWNKVNSGLLKMYRAEVLEKVPIMQHFLFGSIIVWE